MDRLRIAYPEPAVSPVWGIQTSPLNFCEQDYVITAWIAEFINTLTNVSYLIYAGYGIRRFWSYTDFWSRTAPYWGIALVGVTSSLFHGTLRMWPQFSDDLSMLVATGIIFARVMPYGGSASYRKTYGISVTILLVLISIYHCWMAEKTVHNITFLGMVIIVARRTRMIIRDRVQDPELKKRLIGLAKTGSYFSMTGLGVWIIDQKACGQLQAIRDIIGLPWGFLFELHGWWHILTAIGVYDYFVLVEILTGDASVEQNIIDSSPFAWPVSRHLSRSGNGKAH